MTEKTIQYCVNDVVHLPALREYYMRRISGDWPAKAREATTRRLAEVRSPAYEPQSKIRIPTWASIVVQIY